MTVIFGLYDNRKYAEEAIDKLVGAGFSSSDIAVFENKVAIDSKTEGANFHDELPGHVGSFADVNQGQGTDDPLVPELINNGLAQKDAERCAEQVRLGRTLVTVQTDRDNERRAVAILHPTAQDVSDTMQTYIGDMLAVERHIAEAVKRQSDDDKVKQYAQAYSLIAQINDTLERHTTALEQRLESFEGNQGNGVKKVVGAVTGAVAGIYDKIREDRVSRMLRDDYTALSLATMSYTMLHTTALAEKDFPTADMALNHLMDLTPLLVQISENIPEVVAQELRDEGKVVDASVAQEAVANTQRAWKPEHTG
ncbi:MAG: hypothetical protein AAGF95_33325 [Chloroflexota bacterium]